MGSDIPNNFVLTVSCTQEGRGTGNGTGTEVGGCIDDRLCSLV